jgi:hypothetical protein
VSFYVTRQALCYHDKLTVEIAGPTIDQASPGMLVSAYPEEDETFEDPREAAEAAISILKQWRSATPNARNKIAGITLSFSDLCYPSEYDAMTIPQTRAWGKATFEKLPKCDHCGGLFVWSTNEWSGERFCREYCADEYFLAQHKELDASECSHRDDCIFHDPPDIVTCGSCGLSWDDAISTSWTPAPSGRCPFEYQHRYDEDEQPLALDPDEIPADFPVRPIDPEETD